MKWDLVIAGILIISVFFLLSCTVTPPGSSVRKPTDELILSRLDEIQQEIKKLQAEVTASRQPADYANRYEPLIQPSGTSDSAAEQLAIDDGDPVLGNRKASVAIVEFMDYQCPYCARHSQQTFPTIKRRYIDTGEIRYVVRDFPLDFHKEAKRAAIAANCAGEQNAYWQMRDQLFANQSRLNFDFYGKLAGNLGLDTTSFLDCASQNAQVQEVEKDLAYGQRVGVKGTPTFFIGKVESGKLSNVQRLSGAQPFLVFSHVVERYLKDYRLSPR
ncbi:MAG: DsbA family protein [Gammaproteobacteria bacterium]